MKLEDFCPNKISSQEVKWMFLVFGQIFFLKQHYAAEKLDWWIMVHAHDCQPYCRNIFKKTFKLREWEVTQMLLMPRISNKKFE